MTPEQRTEARFLLADCLIRAHRSAIETTLQYPRDALELIRSDVDEVNAMFVRELLPSIDALLEKLQALKVTP